MNGELINPLLPGFYPDPSICRKGNNFYMVNSTFEYFPGVPIFHSTDLVHWHQIGHCLTRPEQLDLDGLKASKGIYAPTIRYNKRTDLFYMVTTLVKNPPYRTNVNFFVTAANPGGPWSDPIIIEGAAGIDPSLFFDDDGRTYYLGNMRPYPDDLSCYQRHIWLQELDLNTGKLINDKWVIRTDGALYNAECPEGPHLYKRNGWYYLMIAEGGTDHNHAATVFRSRTINGDYTGNPRNPLITHRNLRYDFPINSPGHADIISTPRDEWWAVLLASRPDGGDYRILGRETFAVPVIWEEDWPVFSPECGQVKFHFPAPDLPAQYWPDTPSCDQFERKSLDFQWNFLRTPRKKIYSLEDRPGYLRLFLHPETLSESANASFIGRRQQHMHFAARTVMEFTSASENECAGLAVLMNNNYHFRIEYRLINGRMALQMIRRFNSVDEILAEAPCDADKLWFKVTARNNLYSFYYAISAEDWKALIENTDGCFLSAEIAGGFTGTYIGLYASSNGRASSSFADYDWFEYHEIEG